MAEIRDNLISRIAEAEREGWFGDLVLNLDPPDAVPTTRLDLEPRALFPSGPA